MKCISVWKYLDEGIGWIYCSFNGTCGETTGTIDGSSRTDTNIINNKGRQNIKYNLNVLPCFTI